MNVLWMAGLGLAMTAEKLSTTPRLSPCHRDGFPCDRRGLDRDFCRSELAAGGLTVGLRDVSVRAARLHAIRSLAASGRELGSVSVSWSLQGELVLSCSCTVFCPCTLSLGLAPPTEGIRIDEGRFDETDLTGIKAGLIIDIPGLMSRGNWTAGLFIDDNTPIQAVKALIRIFIGRAGGSTQLLSVLGRVVAVAFRRRSSSGAPRPLRARGSGAVRARGGLSPRSHRV